LSNLRQGRLDSVCQSRRGAISQCDRLSATDGSSWHTRRLGKPKPRAEGSEAGQGVIAGSPTS